MEAAMAGIDLGRYRRIVQLFWDPEPTNDQSKNNPIWCLGARYQLDHGRGGVSDETKEIQPVDDSATQQAASQGVTPTTASPAGQQQHNVLSEIPPSELPPSSPPEERSPDNEGGWPTEFLDDFESKFWMTYRSEFEPILKSTDPRASSALSLAMRIKGRLGEQGGFESDSGWGCMIRSGQMLLANTMSFLQLGRGQSRCTPSRSLR
jgi:cysteine protease ATG4